VVDVATRQPPHGLKLLQLLCAHGAGGHLLPPGRPDGLRIDGGERRHRRRVGAHRTGLLVGEAGEEGRELLVPVGAR